MVDTVRHPHTWVITGEQYCYINQDPRRQGSPASLPTFYRRPHAKSQFTKSHDWYDRSYSGWRDPKTGELTEVGQKYFLEGDSLYKIGSDGKFYCIFEPDSEAGWEFINGHMTVRELRDSIPWDQTF